MDVFISWSGERSKAVAESLKNTLPKVINAVKPFLSCSDIERGARWASEIAIRLEQAKVGIICLTPRNLQSNWILFEAGALSKTLHNTFVCPLLIDLEPSDLSGPLAQFQATAATQDGLRDLFQTINRALEEQALPSSQVADVFDAVWLRFFKSELDDLPKDDSKKPTRDDGAVLEEIRDLVWTLVRKEDRQPEFRRPVDLSGAMTKSKAIARQIMEHLGSKFLVSMYNRSDGYEVIVTDKTAQVELPQSFLFVKTDAIPVIVKDVVESVLDSSKEHIPAELPQ